MKRILFVILLIASLTVTSFAEVKIDRIAVINLEQVMEKVFSGTSETLKSLKAEKEEFQSKLDKMKENIMKLEEMKLKESNSDKKIAYDEKIDQMKKEYSDYYKIRNYQIEKKMENAQSSVLTEIYKGVKFVAENDGFTLVLDVSSKTIFYYTTDVDITQKVIDYFQKKMDKN
jgi:outer membrane protein